MKESQKQLTCKRIRITVSKRALHGLNVLQHRMYALLEDFYNEKHTTVQGSEPWRKGMHDFNVLQFRKRTLENAYPQTEEQPRYGSKPQKGHARF